MEAEEQEVLYRMYLTECLRMATENTARQAGGPYVSRRWAEIICPEKARKPDNRGAEEIVEDIVARAGLVVN
jgi:hypothetical protein